MKKKLPALLMLLASMQLLHAQTISPSTDQEFCPGTEVTFTVTVPGTNVFLASWTNSPQITQLPYNMVTSGGSTTFNFKGKFNDVNINQIFRVNYTGPDGNTFADFSFKRIKSLFYHTSCAVIFPSPGFIDAPLCQTSNHNITFSNVQYGTAFENPALCFGSITNYEYLLPAGWSIGATVSNGSNWIPGSNNVTVTSDLAGGNGSHVRIRPANARGTGLINGQQEAIIPIFRSGPLTRINGPGIICSGSEQYSITGLLPGATVSWSIDNISDASIAPVNSTTVNLTRTTSANSFLTLTATVSTCGPSYTVTKFITLGTLYSTHDIVAHYPSVEAPCFETNAFHFFEAEFTGGFQPTQYQWGYRPAGTSFETIIQGDTYIAGPFLMFSAGTYEIFVRTGSECGLISESVRTIEFCDPLPGGNPFKAPSKPATEIRQPGRDNIRLYPNPARDHITLEMPVKYSQGAIKLYSMQGQLLRSERLNGARTTISTEKLPSGTYLIELTDKWGKPGERQKIVITH